MSGTFESYWGVGLRIFWELGCSLIGTTVQLTLLPATETLVGMTVQHI